MKFNFEQEHELCHFEMLIECTKKDNGCQILYVCMLSTSHQTKACLYCCRQQMHNFLTFSVQVKISLLIFKGSKKYILVFVFQGRNHTTKQNRSRRTTNTSRTYPGVNTEYRGRHGTYRMTILLIVTNICVFVRKCFFHKTYKIS